MAEADWMLLRRLLNHHLGIVSLGTHCLTETAMVKKPLRNPG